MHIIDAHSHLWLRQDTVLNGKPIPMYALTTHVHQVQDPSLMPSSDKMTEEALNGALAAIKQILKG